MTTNQHNLSATTQPRVPLVLKNTTYLQPRELEFLAEYESITITPLFRYDKQLKLLECTVGPFIPQLDCVVPLWLALQLKQLKRCIIRPPEWLDPSVLEQHIINERSEKNNFVELPYHYYEIFVLLYDTCCDDIDSVYGYKSHLKIQTLIKDIQDERSNKIINGISNFVDTNRNSVYKLNNIGAMELYEIRPIVINALNTFAKMHLDDANNKPITLHTQPQSSNNNKQRTSQQSTASTNNQSQASRSVNTSLNRTTQFTDSET